MVCRTEAASATRVIKVLHITDPHLLADPEQRFMGLDTAETLQQVLALAQQSGDWPADFVLITGDCVQQATQESYARFRSLLAPLQLPCYCLPGNHDEPALMKTELNRDAVYYQRQIPAGNWQIILLDSSIPGNAAGHLKDSELALLASKLARESDKFTVVVMHHQPVPVYSEWLDTMALAPDNRENLLQLLGKNAQVRLLLWGHVHQEFDGYLGSLRLLATPSTCFQFTPKSEEFSIDRSAPGWRWLYLHPDGTLDTHVARLPQVPASLDVDAGGY